MPIVKWDFYVSMKPLDPVFMASGKKSPIIFSARVKWKVPKIAQNQT